MTYDVFSPRHPWPRPAHGGRPASERLHLSRRGGPEVPPDGGHRGSGHSGGERGGSGRHGGGHRHGRRVFEQGAIKLLALGLVAERPCYGYELIKHIEGLVGGDYSPSPGVIYPTLTYLVDMGWATVQDGEGGRKQYTVTPSGLAQLAQQSAVGQAVAASLADSGNDNPFDLVAVTSYCLSKGISQAADVERAARLILEAYRELARQIDAQNRARLH